MIDRYLKENYKKRGLFKNNPVKDFFETVWLITECTWMIIIYFLKSLFKLLK